MPDASAAGRGAHGLFPLAIVGAGQLARMTCEAASALGLPVAVLAEREDDAAVTAAARVIVGRPTVPGDLAAAAAVAEVLTFDHEHVDLDLLTSLERHHHLVRPGTGVLELAVDKACMRARLSTWGLPAPPFLLLPGATGRGAPTEETLAEVLRFAHDHGWPVVLKAARGGYDGKGVWPVHDPSQAREVCERASTEGTPLLVEQAVPLAAELAVLVARRPGGQMVTWQAVETAQVNGVCREVLVPGGLPAPLLDEASDLARRIADRCGLVGVLAVELFWTGAQLLVNEIAARPHNSGHWTIEGSVTSQFENHLRAVLDLPLGSTALTAPAVASVNVFGDYAGSDPASRLEAALAVDGAHVHLYGKGARPGRKLGHVTVCGSDPGDVRSRAWAAAQALGSPVPGPTTLPEEVR